MTLMKTSNQTKFAPIFYVLPTQHTIHPMFQPPSLAQEVVDSVVGVTMSSTGFVTFRESIRRRRRRRRRQLPICQWQQYSQSEIYKDLGDKAVEYDCAE